MKKVLFVLFVSLITLPSWALQYCQSAAFGYGAAATGGTSTPTQVTSSSALKSALKSNAVVIITQDITLTKVIELKDVKNLTILALPGKKLTNLEQNKDNSGIFYFKSGCSNIVIRNLTFIGPGAYDCNGHDLLSFEGVNKAWVDHCDFQDGVDGNFDNTKSTDNITISWCRFRYLKAAKSGGDAKDHRFTNLVGSEASDEPSDGTYNLTWAYCWWDNGCKERMTRCRNASQHFLNCYWNSSVANYYIGPENADCYIEGCYFEGKPAKDHIFYQNYGGTNGVKFVNCYSKNGVPSDITNKRPVVTPSYTYTAVTYSEAKTMVTNASCGAGATLTVTTAGAVSSSCDGDSPQPEAAPTLNDPNNKSQSVSAGSAIAAITFTASGTATAIAVSSLPSGLSSVTNGLSLTISGTPANSGTYTVTATNASGATTTKQGTISVGSTPGPGPDPIGTSVFWNFSDAAFSNLDTLTASQTIQSLLIAADGEDGKIVVDGNNKSIDGYSFTSRLKTGGAMTATARYLSFAVTGACTIEIYCISSSSTATRTMNVATGTWNNTQQTYEVSGSIAKYTYSYTGTGSTVYIGSADGGINFYAIKVTYSSTSDLTLHQTATCPNKIIRNGQLLIRRDGHWYNVLGLLRR